MLSDKQKEIVIYKINHHVDIPWISESMEGNVIQKVVDKISPALEPALRAVMPDVYVECIRIALTEGITSNERRKKISALLIAELGAPLARALDERVDSSMIPDGMEAGFMEKVAHKILKEFVDWTVGELDDRLSIDPAEDVDETE